MTSQMYARAVVLWFDDALTDAEIDGALAAGGVWERIFGRRASRLFRLMDLSIDVGRSFDEASKMVAYWSSAARSGTYVTAIVDLNLPATTGGAPEAKYGVALAHLLREAGIPLVFLSQNTGAGGVLEKERLSTLPYYAKESDRWRLPDGLAALIIDELRSHVSWISLRDVIAAMHPASSLAAVSTANDRAVLRYPYFGVFRDFLNRWTDSRQSEFPRVFALRAVQSDSDTHLEQSLALILHERFLQRRGQVRLVFGRAADEHMRLMLAQRDAADDPDLICGIRVVPDAVSVDDFRHLLEDAERRAGITALILPLNESADQYMDALRLFRVRIIDEMPHIRVGDDGAREELAGHACALALKEWAAAEKFPLHEEWLALPQLVVHPAHWMSLLESEQVAEDLSDPYEVIAAVHRALSTLQPEEVGSVTRTLSEGVPLPAGSLLRVGANILARPEMQAELAIWTERALDAWLQSSWQFPHGLGRRFMSLRRGHPEDRLLGGATTEDWEDSAFEVLAQLCREYSALTEADASVASKSGDLHRVCRFVRALGETDFLQSANRTNWESLESLRWPHHRYPLPRAVSRRFKAAGRYLWIQPEGVDLAAALPIGRQRYRGLGEVTSTYSQTLAWADDVGPRLPDGWRQDVAYVADAIRHHRVADLWREGRDAEARASRDIFWRHLLGLLRNGAPLMFVADEIARGRPLVGGRSAVAGYLRSVNGYGMILKRLRLGRAERMPLYDVESADLPHGIRTADIERLARAAVSLHAGGGRDGRLDALADVMTAAIMKLGAAPGEASIPSLIRGLEIDQELGFLEPEGWFEDAPHERDVPEALAKLPTLYATKGDHFWQLLDLAGALAHATARFRYVDGYHLLSAIHDLRLQNKDSSAEVPLATINVVMDLFLAGIQGVVAHLAFCLDVAGYPARAAAIDTGAVRLRRPAQRPSLDELAQIMQVVEHGHDYSVYTLGIPGAGSAAKLCYQAPGGVKAFEPQAAV